jgi:hypothetical protein
MRNGQCFIPVAAIADHLLKTWRVAERSVSGKAARAQE